MGEYSMGAVESRFADMIWRAEPVTSAELVQQAAQELAWKKSTTYTALKRLCQRGLFRNQDGVVTSLVSREAFYAAQSGEFGEEKFSGSLPAFLAAFTAREKLSRQELDELQRLIDESRG